MPESILLGLAYSSVLAGVLYHTGDSTSADSVFEALEADPPTTNTANSTIHLDQTSLSSLGSLPESQDSLHSTDPGKRIVATEVLTTTPERFYDPNCDM